jgi:hypothetical protein
MGKNGTSWNSDYLKNHVANSNLLGLNKRLLLQIEKKGFAGDIATLGGVALAQA